MVEFKQLTDNAFRYFAHSSAETYARYIFEAKEAETMEEAMRLSEEEIEPWVNEAVGSDKHRKYRVKTGNQTVGWVWYELVDDGETSFLVYISIDPKFRRRGYASEIMRFFEAESKKLGAKKTILYVFIHNKSAVALYRKFGYKVEKEVASYGATMPTRYKMYKDLVDFDCPPPDPLPFGRED